MGNLYDKWKESVITVYDSQEMSTLELLEDITNFNDEIAQGIDTLDLKIDTEINKLNLQKTDLNGNHLGSWQGINKPTLSDEGMRGTVEKLNDVDIPLIKNDIVNVNSSLEQKAPKQELEVERNRINNLSKLTEGSTTGDAELIDARISGNGVVYDNVGENIRDIAKGKGMVKKCLNRGNTNYYRVETNNIFNENNNIRVFNGKAWTNADGYFDDVNLKTTESIPLNVNTTDIIYTNALYINMLQDETYLSTINGYVGVTIPINVVENCNRLILIFPKDVTPICKVGSYDYERIYDDKLIIQQKNLETIPFISDKKIYKLYKNKLVKNVGDFYEVEPISISNCEILKSNKTKFSTESKRVQFKKGNENSIFYISIPKNYNSFTNLGIWFYIDKKSFDMIDALTVQLYKDEVYKCKTELYRDLTWRVGWNFININTSEFGYGASRDFNKIVINPSSLSLDNVQLNEVYSSIVIDSVFVNFEVRPIVLVNYDDMYIDSDNVGLYDYHLNNNIPYTIFSRDWDKRKETYPILVEKLLKHSSISDLELGIYGTYDDGSGYDVKTGLDFIKTSENIKKNKNALQNLIGDTANSYSCTHNYSSPTIEQGLRDNNIKIARDGRSFQTGFFDKDLLFLSIYWEQNITLEGYKAYIDKVISSGRIGCIFTHGVSNTPTSIDSLATDWFSMLDYLKTKIDNNEIIALTFTDLVRLSEI